MFKHLFPMLLIPVLLLGAGCAQSQGIQTDASQMEESVREEIVFSDGTYIVAAESDQAVTVGWQASKRVGPTHNGTVEVREGALVVQEGSIIGGTIVTDMTTIVDLDLTDKKFNTLLVNHLKSDDFFEVKTYPTGTFAVSEVEALQGIKGATHRVDGTMTIKGIEQEVSFPARITTADDGIQVLGTLALDRTLWDVRFGSDKFFDNLGDGLIEDEFFLEVDMEFLKSQ